MYSLHELEIITFRAVLCLSFLLGFGLLLNAQNQKVADSLEHIHRGGYFEEKEHITILDNLIREHQAVSLKIIPLTNPFGVGQDPIIGYGIQNLRY